MSVTWDLGVPPVARAGGIGRWGGREHASTEADLVGAGVTPVLAAAAERVGFSPPMLLAAGGQRPCETAQAVQALLDDPDHGPDWERWPEYVRDIAAAAAELRVPPAALRLWIDEGSLVPPWVRHSSRPSRGLRERMGERPGAVPADVWAMQAPALLRAGMSAAETGRVLLLPDGHPDRPDAGQVALMTALRPPPPPTFDPDPLWASPPCQSHSTARTRP